MVLQSGETLDPQLLAGLKNSADQTGKDYRKAVLLLCFGLGGLAFGVFVPETHNSITGLSFLPLSLGIAYLIVWKTAPKIDE